MRRLAKCRYLLSVALISSALPVSARAAEQRLSDLALRSYALHDGTVVINTTGGAKLAIAFVSPVMARVQVSPTGAFVDNPSPAVAGPSKPVADTRVEDAAGVLLIRNAGLTLRVDKMHLRVDAYDGGNTRPISLESPADGTTWDADTGVIRHSRILGDAERIYGLGQDNANHGMLDRRGSEREMWTGQQIRSGNVTASYPVPFYLSTGIDGRGYGCFVDNVWHMNLDLGKAKNDRLTWTAPGGPIDYYLIDGPSFKTIIDQYTRLTGRPSMLPLWALGYWQSRCWYTKFEEIMDAADRLRRDGLPADIMVIDANWPNVQQDFKWGKPFLASGRPPSDWLAELRAKGFRVVQSNSGPMIRPNAENYADGWKKNLFATDGHGHPLTAGYYGGHLMDFTHPGMGAWLRPQLQSLVDQGIAGWWLDLIEPEGEPPQAVYYGGKSADIHNTFPLRVFRTYFEFARDVRPTGRPVILGRAASAGTQRYGGIVWTGDINSDWPTFRAHIPEAQNTGLSGLPYWTNDSGGFISGFLDDDRYGAHADLYQRWFEFTCFAPIARAHKAGPAEPFQYGPAVEATAKKYLQLRYRLLPYIYTIAHEAAATGLPMLRPLILEYQDDPGSATAKTEFLFGRDLLVAPVLHAYTTARAVYFPPGRWISYDEEFEVAGGASHGVAAPPDRIPLFVRAGAILPMAPDMSYTDEKPWDPITLDVWPAGESNASLSLDDMTTTAFEKGESTTVAFECHEKPGQSVTFDVTPSNAKFGPKRWVAQFHLTSVPTAVTLDGKALAGWSFDPKANLLTVDFPGNGVPRVLTIALDGSSRPRPAGPQVDVPVIADDAAAAPVKQIAQFLPPPKLPIRIEAANFDKGGNGLAFHVATPSKTPVYRSDGVPIISSSDEGGGYAVADLQKGDWMAYTIDAGDGGWFAVAARVRVTTPGAAFSLRRRRAHPLTPFTIPAGNTWASAAGDDWFYLPPGEQFVTLYVDRPGFEFGSLTFTKANQVGAPAGIGTGTVVGSAKVEQSQDDAKAPVVGLGGPDQAVRLTVVSPVAGHVLVALGYAFEGDVTKLAITPTGDRGVVITLPSSGAWGRYDQAAIPIDLKAGANEIEIRGTGEGSALVRDARVVVP